VEPVDRTLVPLSMVSSRSSTLPTSFSLRPLSTTFCCPSSSAVSAARPLSRSNSLPPYIS